MIQKTNKIIHADLFRYTGMAGVMGFLNAWKLPGFRYTFILREFQKYRNNRIYSLFFRFLRRRYRIKYGYDISPDVQIGEGLYLTNHSGYIIIGPVTIGKNCNIGHGVTIGRTNKDGNIYRPVIGDYVWIGPGSVVVGNIKVGNYVLIAPNSFVNFDIPDHSLIIGNPGKIISRENPTKDYIHNILNK